MAMVMEAMANRRLRLHFKDRSILTNTQKKLGLKRSWLLLKPHHHTISDVVSNILDAFNLHQSCPHGILLSMDGFVLPSFESTIILKDKDLVSVRGKGSGVKANIKAVTFNEDEIVEKQPLPSGVRLLANEEFNKGAGGYESETDADEVEVKESVQSAGSGDVALKKRKASSPTESSKKKRLRQISPECVQKKDIDHCENIISLWKKSSNAGVNKGEVTGTSINNSEQRYDSNEFEEKKEVTVHASDAHDGARKVSRSTWRNMRKRQWRRVGRANNNKEGEKKCPLKDLGKVTKIVKNVNGNIEQPAEEASDTDADDDLVPVVIRPGHIRFSSASKAKNVQQVQEANVWDVKKNQENGWVQIYQEANGWDVQLTQKNVWDHSAQKNVWDSHQREVAKPSRKGFRDYNGQSSNSRIIENQQSSSDNGRIARCWPTSDQQTSSCKQFEDHNTQSSDTRGSSPEANDFSMDLEKLMPLIDSPQVGDIIAYRLLELSSSWCPELSFFRVGKITSFDHETNIIMLVPQAEYPLNIKRKADNDHDDDDSGQPPQSSVYNEDGSLEIEFPSLVDVRIVKSAKPSHSGDAEVPIVNSTPGSAGMSTSTDRVDNGSKDVPLDITGQELHTPTNLEDRKKDVWEEIREALSAKKAQLMQEDAWNKKESLTKQS